MEIWKQIEDTNGFYQVSSIGRVKSVERLVNYKDHRKPRLWPEKILSGYIGTSGYRQVELKIEGRIRKEEIHRLVCLAFHKKPDDKNYVNHKDHDKMNNKEDNVEWCDNGENVRHSFATGNHSGHGGTHYRARKIKGPDGTIYETQAIAAVALKVHPKIIYNLCSGKTKNNYLGVSYFTEPA